VNSVDSPHVVLDSWRCDCRSLLLQHSGRGAAAVFSRGIGLAAATFISVTSSALAEAAGLWREKDGGTIRVYRCGMGLTHHSRAVQTTPQHGASCDNL